MDHKFEIPLMVKVAERYYLRGLKQEEIARELNIARSTISVILNAARECGIVEIKIHDPQTNQDSLSLRICDRFSLPVCLVVPTAQQNPDNQRKMVVQRAMHYLNDIISPGMTIGLAWGRTCSDFVDVYEARQPLSNIQVAPLVGGSNQNAPYFQINEMVRRLAGQLSGQAFFIHAPASCATADEKIFYMQSSAMKPILDFWAKLDLVLTGIGSSPKIDQNRREQYTGESGIYHELGEEAVGDICMRYFDVNGQFLNADILDRSISIPVAELRKTGRVIAMASGIEKAQAICGALRTGVIHTLVTDEQTARSVCEAAG
ncbi:MAG: sugar-binding domain-containing protein [Bacillota bacterium]|nr:sugar-binding domain-containing protein [Bacillota bacterium]